MLDFGPKLLLPEPAEGPYRGLAFDGTRYYLTVQGKARVAVVDGELGAVEVLDTGRPYTTLCYDSERDCFWACSDRDRGKLYRLDRDFREVGRLVPRWEGRRPGPITGVSFCPQRGLLAVSCGGRLLEVDPENGWARLLWEERGDGLILAVACSFPYLLFSVLREGAARFVLAACDGVEWADELAPDLSLATAFLFLPGGRDLRLLAGGYGGAPALWTATLGERHRAALELWEGEPDPAACAGVLASVARLEAAMAHILNAEGEKLQTLLGRPELSAQAERSACRTLRAVAQLEEVLLAKLRALPDLCGDEEPDQTVTADEGMPLDENNVPVEEKTMDEAEPFAEGGAIPDGEGPPISA